VARLLFEVDMLARYETLDVLYAELVGSSWVCLTCFLESQSQEGQGAGGTAQRLAGLVNKRMVLIWLSI
jgi:hypothetical protein